MKALAGWGSKRTVKTRRPINPWPLLSNVLEKNQMHILNCESNIQQHEVKNTMVSGLTLEVQFNKHISKTFKNLASLFYLQFVEKSF